MKNAKITWQANVPKSVEFNDIYYNSTALDEIKYVFLLHNKIQENIKKHKYFTIIETGFGTGLNFLTTWDKLDNTLQTGQQLHFISVEKYPLHLTDLRQALHHWPALKPYADILLAHYPPALPGFHHLPLTDNVTLTLLFGEATDMLTQLTACADAWFLDGFAPSKNPDMWSTALFRQMARLSRPGTTFATFTAASTVRKGLAEAGFKVEKAKGFGRKREMLYGIFDKATATQTTIKPWLALPPKRTSKHTVAIIGAGLAGCATAYALARKQVPCCLIDANTDIAQAASGNPIGLLTPRLSPDHNLLDQYLSQGFLYARHIIERLIEQAHPIKHNWCGTLHLAVNQRLASRFKLINKRRTLPAEFARLITATEASDLAGVAISDAALWLPSAGYVKPADVCRALADAAKADTLFNTQVTRYERQKGQWLLFNGQDELVAQTEHVIIANADAATQFPHTALLPITGSPGQLTLCAATPLSHKLKTALSYEGYLTPDIDGQHILGATYRHDGKDIAPKQRDHAYNLDLLKRAVPALYQAFVNTPPQAHVATRAITPDHLPLVGPLAEVKDFEQRFARLCHGEKACRDKAVNYLPGLYINAGHGSKGLASGLLAGEIIAAEIAGTALPISRKVYEAIHPLRFWVRQLKRNGRVLFQ